jgi:ribosomal protein L12E/L44/L45/RPP1/RPP2
VREKGTKKKKNLLEERERRRICIPIAPNQRKKFNCAAKPKRKK